MYTVDRIVKMYACRKATKTSKPVMTDSGAAPAQLPQERVTVG